MVSFLAGFRKGRVVRLPYALHYTYGYRKVQGEKQWAWKINYLSPIASLNIALYNSSKARDALAVHRRHKMSTKKTLSAEEAKRIRKNAVEHGASEKMREAANVLK